MAPSLLLLALAVFVPATDAFRVLGLFPFNGRSHNIMFKAAMEALADRGHDVVVLSPFPLKQPRANYTDLDLSKHFPSLVNSMTYEQISSFEHSEIVQLIGEIAGANLCRAVFETQHFRDLMAGVHGKFDVVFTEVFGSDCWAAVAYKLNLPLISIATAPDYAWIHERVGAVDNPSYLVVNNRPHHGSMSLLERAQNAFAYIKSNLAHKYYVQWPSDLVVREYFGADTPPVSELARRTSLVMVNAHPAIHAARPLPPNVIHVGGLHLGHAKHAKPAPLEAGLRRWMDGAEHGVIFFSLGSLVRADSLPAASVRGLLRAFAALPQRVLWKYESNDLADSLAGNVRTASWIPQSAVLAHPKTILFITHGGLMGTTEAIVEGVPMLGIPLFADQFPNVELYKALGIAERLDHTDITEQRVLAVVRKMTETDEYRVRAKEIRARYKDVPMSATDSAVWWTEYVVRHGGAPHLRPLGADMPLYQYLLLDVAALALVLALAAVGAVLLVVRALLRVLLFLVTPKQAEKAAKKLKKHQ